MAWEFEKDGQVVCIDANFQGLGLRGEKLPVKDAIYTIRDLEVYDDELAIRLYEIVNVARAYGKEFTECLFIAHKHFRPVKKTDISELTGLLKKNYDLGDMSAGLDDGEYLPRELEKV